MIVVNLISLAEHTARFFDGGWVALSLAAEGIHAVRGERGISFYPSNFHEFRGAQGDIRAAIDANRRELVQFAVQVIIQAAPSNLRRRLDYWIFALENGQSMADLIADLKNIHDFSSIRPPASTPRDASSRGWPRGLINILVRFSAAQRKHIGDWEL